MELKNWEDSLGEEGNRYLNGATITKLQVLLHAITTKYIHEIKSYQTFEGEV